MDKKPGIDNLTAELQKNEEELEAELLEFLNLGCNETLHDRAATTIHGLSNVSDFIVNSTLSEDDKAKLVHRINVSSSEVMELSMLGTMYESWAYRDPLTGLKTKRVIPMLTKNSVERLQRGSDMLVAAIDVNGTKRVNDSLGHIFGDILISDYGICLRHGRDDIVAIRLGGDEFVIVVSPIEAPKSPHWGEMILSRLMGQLDSTASAFKNNLGEENLQVLQEYCVANNLSIPDFRVSMGASMFRKGVYRTYRVFDQCDIRTTVKRTSKQTADWTHDAVIQLYNNLLLSADIAMYDVKRQVKR